MTHQFNTLDYFQGVDDQKAEDSGSYSTRKDAKIYSG